MGKPLNLEMPQEESAWALENADLPRSSEESKEASSKEHHSGSDSIAPLLYVDVNLGPEDRRRIVVYEGDVAEELALQFCAENELDEDTQDKLTQLLQAQIEGVLARIEEESDQV